MLGNDLSPADFRLSPEVCGFESLYGGEDCDLGMTHMYIRIRGINSMREEVFCTQGGRIESI